MSKREVWVVSSTDNGIHYEPVSVHETRATARFIARISNLEPPCTAIVTKYVPAPARKKKVKRK